MVRADFNPKAVMDVDHTRVAIHGEEWYVSVIDAISAVWEMSFSSAEKLWQRASRAPKRSVAPQRYGAIRRRDTLLTEATELFELISGSAFFAWSLRAEAFEHLLSARRLDSRAKLQPKWTVFLDQVKHRVSTVAVTAIPERQARVIQSLPFHVSLVVVVASEEQKEIKQPPPPPPPMIMMRQDEDTVQRIQQATTRFIQDKALPFDESEYQRITRIMEAQDLFNPVKQHQRYESRRHAAATAATSSP
jgi:hypothetical protein